VSFANVGRRASFQFAKVFSALVSFGRPLFCEYPMRLLLLPAIILASAVSGCGSYLPLLSTPTTMSASVSEARRRYNHLQVSRGERLGSPVSLDERLNQAAEHQARAVAATGILSHGEFTSRMAQYGIRG
jgi:hypothetical protein